MSASRSCIVREFPLPEREYRVSPPARWDGGLSPQSAPSRRARRQKRSGLFSLILAGLALFCCGFLLGRAGAAEVEGPDTAVISAQASDSSIQTPEAGGTTVKILDTIGSVFFGEKEDAAGNKPEGDFPAPAADWNLMLINQEHLLSKDYAIPELTQLKNGHAVDSRIYPELQAMMDAARAAGYQPTICSSYRSWDKQEELFERKVSSCMAQASSREEAEELAAVWVARPGSSEHQAGLAVDIVDLEYQLLDQAQEDRPVQQWLMAHCAEYGFILRYPTDKSALTGIGYEPWHYRYVGKEAAKAIMDSGLCLEEYLAQC